MKKLTIIGISILLAACANFAVSPGVEGRVTDTNGQPVQARIVIEHTQLEGKVKETETDGHGYFSMSGLRMWTPIPFAPVKMSAQVTVTAPGYESYVYVTEGLKAEIKEIKLEAE